MSESKNRAQIIVNSTIEKLINYKKKPSNKGTKIKKVILIIAIILLLMGIYYSILDNPEILNNINWKWIGLVLVAGVPLTVFFNAYEFFISAKMISVHVSFVKSIEVTVIGSAANMLPIPGSTIVRVAALKMSGAGYRKSALVTLLIAFVWIGVSFLFAGSMLSLYPEKSLGISLLVFGAFTLLFTIIVSIKSKIKTRHYLNLFMVKLSLVFIDAVRIYWCFQAIDVIVDFSQASTFVISSVLGSAVSIVPAGLGVREYVSAGIAPIIGVAASAGFLTATLNRIIFLTGILPVAGILTFFNNENNG
jgi:uncharacterized membrane protein YbhN (UPF0104 family)